MCHIETHYIMFSVLVHGVWGCTCFEFKEGSFYTLLIRVPCSVRASELHITRSFYNIKLLLVAVAIMLHSSQIATAVYFVLIDTVTMSQYFYYLFKNQGIQGMKEKEREREREIQKKIKSG